MQILKIGKYLPDTVTTSDHSLAVEMKSLLDEMAKANDSEVKTFEILDKGTTIVGFSKEAAIDPIASQFKALDHVEVSTLSALQVQFERNRAHQETIDKKRQAKAQRREGAN